LPLNNRKRGSLLTFEAFKPRFDDRRPEYRVSNTEMHVINFSEIHAVVCSRVVSESEITPIAAPPPDNGEKITAFRCCPKTVLVSVELASHIPRLVCGRRARGRTRLDLTQADDIIRTC
jgi:hypothetical protein